MRGEIVIDASVLGAAFFNEEYTDAARNRLGRAGVFLAPDLICLELASIAAKKVRRGEEDPKVALRALAQIEDVISEVVAVGLDCAKAFQLAAEHGFSVYDASYIVLAQARQAVLLTADIKLVRRAGEAGLGEFVEALQKHDA